jgi:EmrB/QacA subfamily drug resistance transporter
MNDRRAIAIGASVATCLAGLDLALVSTAMPTVVAQLGGLELYAWAFSAYLLSSTVAIPVYGKLADLYGRKRMFLIASGIFLVGSALCGAAQTMPQLIAFRLLQGFGGGGLYPITLTIVGDAFDLQPRARLLGLLAAVWGVSAVIGPAVGGFLTEQLSWRWAFLVQLPLAALSMALMAAFLHEQLTPGPRRFDVLGMLLLGAAAAAILLGLQGVGSPIALVALGLMLAVLFVVHERRTTDPLISPHLFANRAITIGSLSCLLVGVVLFGAESFVPQMLQGVLGASPTAAGLTLSSMSLGWPIAANICGRLLGRWGFRTCGLLGALLLVVGFFAWRLVQPGTSLAAAAAIQVTLGAGFGFVSPVALLAMQNTVGWTERGVVTGLNQFATTLGGAIGVALAGALFAASLHTGAPLETALAPVFWLFLLTSIVTVIVLALLPRGAAT